MQSDNCTINAARLLCTINAVLYGEPVVVTYHYEPQDEYGNPGYYEIHNVKYKGVDIWPVYPNHDAAIRLLERAVQDAELLEAEL